MRKETITYTDYDGNERTEDFYFNLNKAELLDLEMSWDGGLKKVLEKIVAAQDVRRISEMFKMIVLKAYGEKSLDGKKFIKEDENGRSLAQINLVPTEAYSEIYTKLASDAEYASQFINDIMPKNLEPKDHKKAEDSKILPGPGAENK